jgi:hypothetical protein
MATDGLRLRAKLFVQRFWQPTSACMTCMPGSWANVLSLPHWEIALRTGLLTGALVLLLSFTRFVTVFRNRYGNALVVGCLTAIGDAYSHADHYGNVHAEALVTGAVSGLIALFAGYLLEDRARRVRVIWTRLRGG